MSAVWPSDSVFTANKHRLYFKWRTHEYSVSSDSLGKANKKIGCTLGGAPMSAVYPRSFNFPYIKGCQLPHLHSQAVAQHISAMKKACFMKFGSGFWNSELVVSSGAPKDCFLWNTCSEKQKLLEFSIAWGRLEISRRPFYSCTIFEAYLIKSQRLSQDGLLVIPFIFAIRFCFSFFIFAA